MKAWQIAETLEMREIPELIVFSEEFIQSVMQDERSSIVLFTNNVNKDSILPYFE